MAQVWGDTGRHDQKRHLKLGKKMSLTPKIIPVIVMGKLQDSEKSARLHWLRDSHTNTSSRALRDDGNISCRVPGDVKNHEQF